MAWKIKDGLICEEEISTKHNLRLFVTTRNFGNMRELEQRNILAKTINLDIKNLVYGEQVHNNEVFVVRDEKEDNYIKGIDGLVTNRRFIPLAIFTADCLPLFIIDPVNRAVGLLHCGWKGLSLNIIDKGLLMMKECYNSKMGNCCVGIGPHIRPCCFTVGKEVMDKFNGKDGEKKTSSSWSLDLGKVVKRELIELGIKKENISICNMCTVHQQEHFFSYRRDKEKNRMMSLIMLK
ncbi:peptidoglycan editing factor PgeF [bacterium]|nr:peptidoglycan editing factor PgeF [bacterium]